MGHWLILRIWESEARDHDVEFLGNVAMFRLPLVLLFSLYAFVAWAVEAYHGRNLRMAKSSMRNVMELHDLEKQFSFLSDAYVFCALSLLHEHDLVSSVFYQAHHRCNFRKAAPIILAVSA